MKIGLEIAIPEGTYARIAPRSGLAVKQFIDVVAGVVDGDYRGEVGIVLFHHADNNFCVRQGEWIAQLILERTKTPAIEVVNELDDASRGATVLGNTGV